MKINFKCETTKTKGWGFGFWNVIRMQFDAMWHAKWHACRTSSGKPLALKKHDYKKIITVMISIELIIRIHCWNSYITSLNLTVSDKGTTHLLTLDLMTHSTGSGSMYGCTRHWLGALVKILASSISGDDTSR